LSTTTARTASLRRLGCMEITDYHAKPFASKNDESFKKLRTV